VSADGLTIVDKPAGWTSHDVVARMRRLAHTRRVGHAGTLDPMATGVLVLGVNRATRLLHHLVLTDKAYTATIRLGQATVTDDAEGELTETHPAGHLDEPAIRAAMTRWTGTIAQVPSSVSAIKINGERAYTRARAGEPVELAAREVTVARFDLLALRRPTPDLVDVDVVVECSSGTYVRALARDVGTGLAVGGHLTALRRTRVGPFGLEQAATMDELAERADPIGLPLADAVAAVMPVRPISQAEVTALGYGQSIEPAGLVGTYGALGPDGRVIALLDEQSGRARPVLVFHGVG
jgi:tRNA pseudouridine55 synthase